MIGNVMSYPVFHIETELEADGRYIAEVVELPGVMAYGDTETRAIDAVKCPSMPATSRRSPRASDDGQARQTHGPPTRRPLR